MKTLYFDRQTLKGSFARVGNADIAIEVDDDCCNVKKIINKYEKDIHKVNEDGQPLYLQNVYEIITKENVVGYEQTTEVTDTPCIETVWKTNKQGFKLYRQNIYNKDGSVSKKFREVTNHMHVFSYKKESYFEITDIVIGEDEEGNSVYEQIEYVYEVPDKYEYNKPIYVDVHIKDEDGNKLYLKPVVEIVQEEIVSDVIETTAEIQVFSYKEEEITRTVSVVTAECNHVCDEHCNDECKHICDEYCEPIFEDKEISEIVQVPDKYEANTPVMIPIYKEVEVDILSRVEEFTIIELLEFIYQRELLDKKYNYILADMFINEDDIDFEYEEHSANTGAFVCSLLPKGKVQLKELELETKAKTFEIILSEIPTGIDVYVNDVKFVNNKAILPSNADSCVIRFENTTDKPLDIKSYCIAY